MSSIKELVPQEALEDELVARVLDYINCVVYAGNRGRIKDTRVVREKLREAIYFGIEWNKESTSHSASPQTP